MSGESRDAGARAAGPPPLVSVVLVSWNCGRFVDGVLPSLLRQTYPAIEVLVVDNGSTDGGPELVEASYPGARVIRLGRNTGFSHALNQGIRQTRGPYVLSLNFDVVLEPGFVEALVQALETRPEAGWATGALRQLRDHGVVDAIDCVGHYFLPSRYCYGHDPAHPEPEFYSAPREVFGASACGALYRRAMLEDLAVGGEIFDEDLFAYFEDVDLDWRAQQLGYRCVFTPQARGAHMRYGADLSGRAEVVALLRSNRFLVMLKNDEWRDVARDAGAILRRTVRDALADLRSRPGALPRAVARLVRLAPAMLRKRRHVKRRRVVSREYLASLRLETPFLG